MGNLYLFLLCFAVKYAAETSAKNVVADDNAAERMSLNNVQVDNPPNLDSSGSTEHDADDSEASMEADVEEGSPKKDSATKKRKKISNYSIGLCVLNIDNFFDFAF